MLNGPTTIPINQCSPGSGGTGVGFEEAACVLRGRSGVLGALALVALGIASCCSSWQEQQRLERRCRGRPRQPRAATPERAATAYVSRPDREHAGPRSRERRRHGLASPSTKEKRERRELARDHQGWNGLLRAGHRNRLESAFPARAMTARPGNTSFRPSRDGTRATARVQPYMYVDPATDRLFFLTSAASGGGFDLSITSGGGPPGSTRAWRTTPSTGRRSMRARR